MKPLLTGAFSAMLCTHAAIAQQSLMTEVVVTAELRDTPLLQQPASTSVVDAQTLRARSATHLEELLAVAPNVNYAGGSSRARFFQIRGVGERSQFVEPLNPSIGLLIDDIDFSGLGTAGTLFDIEQVEVLRGPQGTLHGANALAGLINVRSAAPEDTFAARLEGMVADYGTRQVAGMVTGPVSEDLSYRLAFSQYRSDGFIENAFLGRDDTSDRDELGLRGRLRWQPSVDDQLDLIVHRTEIDNGYDAFSLDNTRTTLSDQPGSDRLETDALGLQWQHDMAHTRLTVLLSGASTDTLYSYDEDWSYVGIAPALEYSSFDAYDRDRDSASAQLRLSSLAPLSVGGLTLHWVTGGYILENRESLLRRYTYQDSDFRSDFDTRTSAVFADVEWEASERLSLSAGVRVARRATDYADSNGVAASPDSTLWGGRLVASLAFTPDQMLYAQLSRGYRGDGVNAGVLAAADTDLGPQLPDGAGFYDEETLRNLEFGHKGQWQDGRLTSRLALFLMDREDQQVRGSLVIPRADGSTAFIDYTDNAASGSNLGIEWEVSWQPTDALLLNGSLGLLDTEFDRYINADGDDLSGREQAHAPGYQFHLAGDYLFSDNWRLRLEVEGRDAFYFSDRHPEQSDPYALAHARLGYDSGSWSVALWGRNLFDEDYAVRGFGSFGNDPRKGYVVEPYYQYGEPRLIGISADYRW